MDKQLLELIHKFNADLLAYEKNHRCYVQVMRTDNFINEGIRVEVKKNFPSPSGNPITHLFGKK